MQKKNNLAAYSIAVFSFLYSGTVLYSPFYASGSAVLHYLVTGAAILVYSYAAARYFAARRGIGTRGPAGIFGVTVAFLTAVAAGSLVAEYVRALGGFAEEYGSLFTVVFAAGALLVCSIYGALRGRICVSGVACLAVWLFVVWTAAGFFAFFSVKRIVPLGAPFAHFLQTDVLALVKNTARVCLDITLLAVVLTDNESESVRALAPKAFLYGALGYVLLGGFNVFKNLLLFGEELCARLNNPDLAAIRLAPLFDLPEISVIADTFACAVKISVYACAVMFVLKDAFGERYSSRVGAFSVTAVAGAACAGILVLRGTDSGAVGTGDGWALICLAVAVFLCYVLYSAPLKSQNQTK